MIRGVSMTLETGRRIGPYEIIGWLGAGGMGEVYRARDARLGRDVAIKLLPEAFATDAGRLHRFEQEARAAGQLNHPNILAVYDVGTHAGAPYLVSELLEGETLRSRLAPAAVATPESTIPRAALSSRKALDYARQIAEGLAAAHDKGIVHRDVKPDNLFITTDGRVKILDFGIAKLTRPSDDAPRHAGLPTETASGMVTGTAAYMSPEQVRGEAVDVRSDIFSFGAVLYEMLTGRAAFARATAADTTSAILKEDPPDPISTTVSPAIERIVSRCLEKSRDARFQSARDLAFGLEVLSGTDSTPAHAPIVAQRRWRSVPRVAFVVLSLLAAVAGWLWVISPPSIETRLSKATYTTLTAFEGAELDAAISPDGNLVAFLAPAGANRRAPLPDRVGPFHAWLIRVGTGSYQDLTPGEDDLRNRQTSPVGFSADGAEVWICGTPYGRRLRKMPYIGGAPQVFLEERAIMASWSSDGTRLVYYTYDDGDPLYVADRIGSNPRRIHVGDKKGDHNHFPTWSTDGRWIYYVHYVDEPGSADLWRVPSVGGQPQRMTWQYSDVRFPTPIDARTVLYVARAGDGSGPWLWALDVKRGGPPRRVSAGPNRYLSVGASADGQRLVVTDSKASASLWSVPILDRLAEDSDSIPYPLPPGRALAPRFAPSGVLFYLSSNGPGDGLWRLQDGKPVEIWKGSDGHLLDPPAVSADGTQVAVALRTQGLAHLTVVSTDGAKRRSIAESLHVRGTAAWSPDARWIVTGGRTDADGPGLFKIPVDGGRPQRLVPGQAFDPVWSPTGDLIVYAGPLAGGTAPLLAVRPSDGRAVNLPAIRTSAQGGGCVRFLPDGKSLVYLHGKTGEQGLSLLDLITNITRPLALLSSTASTSSFDITPDGKQIVFDRLRENSDIVLINLPK